MKSKYYQLIALSSLLALTACDYLDVTPDNIATIDYAFNNRNAAERYLYTCYGYRPQTGDLNNDPAMYGGDETWLYYGISSNFTVWTGAYIGRGYQNANDPYLNFWDGARGARSLWQGIRDCNIFLENIGRVADIQEYERTRWIAEAKFLKAWYHYYLFKCYGPIPVTDVNLPVSAGVSEVRVYRDPVDKVVDYIAALMLEAAKELPDASGVIEGSEAGRVDKLVATAMRAELLLFAASPLFNGNTDYSGMKDNRGVQLFNPTYDANKWKLAADACREAIDLCHAQRKALYDQTDPQSAGAPEALRLETTLRQAVCDRWNKELIWGGTNHDCPTLTGASHARTMRMSNDGARQAANTQFAPTMKAVEFFYSSNGVPIEEDTQWQAQGWYGKRYEVRPEPSSGDEICYVKEGQLTANLHYNREPRFYASVGFDRGIFYGSGYYDFPANVQHCEFMNLEYSGLQTFPYSATGYAAKKMASVKCGVTANNFTVEYYPFPIMRLSNLYLMYAEALNESGGPSEEAYKYIDLVRARAGLKGVRESWRDHSSNPGKPNSKEGLRDVIRRERTVELAFEGKRFWDIRRWKMIGELNNQPQGWNVQGENRADFYKVVSVAKTPVNFTVKDYFWPIRESTLVVNRNLVQNYGW